MAGRRRRKRATLAEAQPVRRKGGRSSVVVNLCDGLAQGALIQDLFLVDQARHEGGGAHLIDAARNAFGVLEDALQGVVGKEGARFVAGDLRLMLDVADGLLQIERAEVIANREALVERFMNGKMEGAPEIRMADQHHGGEGLTVHLVTEQRSEE